MGQNNLGKKKLWKDIINDYQYDGILRFSLGHHSKKTRAAKSCGETIDTNMIKMLLICKRSGLHKIPINMALIWMDWKDVAFSNCGRIVCFHPNLIVEFLTFYFSFDLKKYTNWLLSSISNLSEDCISKVRDKLFISKWSPLRIISFELIDNLSD